MSKFETIVVALDFSDCSSELAERAGVLAGEHGAALVLLHVDNMPAGVPADAEIEVDARRERAGDYLQRASSERLGGYQALLRDRGVTRVSCERVAGPVAEAIAEAAQRHQADLILMGTHGRRGLARLLAGSVSEAVKGLAACEVQTLPTTHKKTCAARSCDYCNAERTPELGRLAAEADG